MIKILLTEPIRPLGMDYLAKEPDVEIVIAPDARPETAAGLAVDCQGIISRNTRIDRRVFRNAPKLKVVASHGVGTDHVDVEAATAHGICVVNTPGANAESVAEVVTGFMLMLSRKLAQGDRALRIERDYYSRNRWIGRDLFHKTILIVGLGAIGRRLARICKEAFEMRVLGYDPYLTEEQLAALGVEKVEDLNQGLPQADFVSLNCPYTGELYHLINARRLALMKPDAYLINCARGQLIDDKALAEALKSEKIAGAALDVFSQEPPDRDDPLFDCPNLIATPHIGANAQDSIDNMSLLSAKDVMSVIRGEPGKARVANRQALADREKPWERLAR